MGKSKILGIRKCANCGNDVIIRHKDRMERERVFCSQSCFNSFKKDQNLNCVCVVCGKKFHSRPSHLKRYNKQGNCCSKKCRAIYLKSIYAGENNPNYNNRGNKNPMFKKDMNKLNNAVENLQILTRSEHKKLHHKLNKLK